MSLAWRLERLREAVSAKQPGVPEEKAYVERQDLLALLHQFDRLDAEARSNLEK